MLAGLSEAVDEEGVGALRASLHHRLHQAPVPLLDVMDTLKPFNRHLTTLSSIVNERLGRQGGMQEHRQAETDS